MLKNDVKKQKTVFIAKNARNARNAKHKIRIQIVPLFRVSGI